MELIVHQGDATSLEFLEHCNMSRFQIVVVAVPDPSTAQTLIRHVRTLSADAVLVVRARYAVSCRALKAMAPTSWSMKKTWWRRNWPNPCSRSWKKTACGKWPAVFPEAMQVSRLLPRI